MLRVSESQMFIKLIILFEFQFCLASLLISIAESAATGYGSGSGGYGSGGGGGGGGGAGAGSFINVGGNGAINALSNSGPIPAAIQSSHTVEIQTVPIPYNPVEPQVVEVDANILPLTIHFKSASSNINVVQSHQPGQVAQVQQTSSEDEPHHLLHEVTKPIIQEIREVITPYRRVVQEVRPVQEEIQTIVARGEHRQQPQQQQYNDFGAFNSGRPLNQQPYGGSNTYGSSSGTGISSLGGSVSILSGESGSRSSVPGSTGSVSSFAGKKSKSESSGVVTQERTKDYSKSS